MPGPRSDKERAWETLWEVLLIARQSAQLLAELRGEVPSKAFAEGVERVYLDLKTNSRLSAGQVRLIRKLVQAVILVERNTPQLPPTPR